MDESDEGDATNSLKEGVLRVVVSISALRFKPCLDDLDLVMPLFWYKNDGCCATGENMGEAATVDAGDA